MSELQGRRIPDGEWKHWHQQASDYGFNAAKELLWVCLPSGVEVCVPTQNAHVGLYKVRWDVTESEGGLVTVDPSINLNPIADREGWHGWLQNGVWRDA